MMANLQWWSEDVSITMVADANPQLGPAEISTNGNFYYSGTGAVVRVKDCKNPSHTRQILYTSLRVHDSHLGDASTMKKLATAYTKAVADTDECA